MSGNHTWDIHIRYHLCPNCKTIVESRKNWTLVKDHFEKELRCPRCGSSFMATLPKRSFGPIFGNPSKPEFDWS